MLTQTSDTDGTGPDLLDEVGAEIQVTLDRWSVGHIGWSEMIAAAVVFGAVAVVAWIMRRLVGRWTKDWQGPAAAAASLLGRVVSLGLHLFATAIALELLGLTVGQVLMIIALITVVFLFLQPVVQHLSSGFVLQLRGPLHQRRVAPCTSPTTSSTRR